MSRDTRKHCWRLIHKRKLKNQSFLSCSGTSLKEHLWNKDTWLIRTLDQVPTSYEYIFSYWNKDTSLIGTIILVPVTIATNESWMLFPSLPLMNYVALMQYRRRSSELKCYQANVEGYMKYLNIVHGSINSTGGGFAVTTAAIENWTSPLLLNTLMNVISKLRRVK